MCRWSTWFELAVISYCGIGIECRCTLLIKQKAESRKQKAESSKQKSSKQKSRKEGRGQMKIPNDNFSSFYGVLPDFVS